MNSDTFSHFSKLPPEIRRHIWQYCLPHRTAEEDFPYLLLDGNESRQACWAKSSTYQNAQKPVIAFVNRESRRVALEHGQIWEPPDPHSLESIWVQPSRDALLLNYTRTCDLVMYGTIDAASSVVVMFLWRAEEHKMQPCIVAKILHDFNLKMLLDGAAASENPRIMYEHADSGDSGDIAGYAECIQLQKIVLGIAMGAISLHISAEAALGSGLFGLLGDAPVQLVDFDDEARLRRFYTLFKENALDEEPVVQTLFELFLSSRFRTAVDAWRRQADWIIMANLWHYARESERYDDILGADPSSAWTPQLEECFYFSMLEYLPNEDHPWVKQAREKAPRLRPQIVVRYCTHKCYTGEQLPDHHATNLWWNPQY
ncbi:hypothetical protein CFAM422_003563 [Trichoderma lentiforme]|uniref:2EXR domain-containing protein n=1 Tax=Trichoderma lentiforme TaxID=1567552 RepID=A0A9P4XLE0_9HYPO|nr:hypothetical protein CFAM422_003563 [Trichoderma lentiforme]